MCVAVVASRSFRCRTYYRTYTLHSRGSQSNRCLTARREPRDCLARVNTRIIHLFSWFSTGEIRDRSGARCFLFASFAQDINTANFITRFHKYFNCHRVSHEKEICILACLIRKLRIFSSRSRLFRDLISFFFSN